MSKIDFKFSASGAITILVLYLLLISANTQAQPGLNIPRPIVLKGTIVSSHGIIQGGCIVIENHKISSISKCMNQNEMPANAIYVDTKGIIFPGLIDLHNHVSYNVFPAWTVGKEKFSNRYEWRFHSQEHENTVKNPSDNMNGFYCQMNTWGELRALVGGTTSILNTFEDNCIHGLVRNLDDPTQLDDQQIECYIDIQNHDTENPDKSEKIFDDLTKVKRKLISGNLDAFFIHLAEGKATDVISKKEFGLLQSKGLLTDKTAIIHGIALGRVEFRTMHNAGASLVWSPRSNIQLYGQTTDIITAKNQGVRIALAPDWAITGSKNMLEELRYAADWNKRNLNSLFSDKDLVEMVTSIPAAIAGIDKKVGSIREGFYADLLVISGNSLQPYSSLVQAGTDDVKLVLINGSPLYGTKDLMERFWISGQLEQLLNSSPPMMLKLPLPEDPKKPVRDVNELEQSLRIKMAAVGTSLAPLFPPQKDPTEIKKPSIDVYPKPGIKDPKPGIKN